MKLIKMECPNCKAPLEVDQDRQFVFCQYCGFKIFLNDETQRIDINAKIEQTIRHVDEAEVAAENTKREKIAYKRELLSTGKRGVGCCIILPIMFLGIFMILFVGIGYLTSKDELIAISKKKSKQIENGYIAIGDGAYSYKYRDYKTVINQIKANGFTNIVEVNLDDADEDEYWEKGEVSAISIGGDSNFEEGEYFDPNATVVVTYH